MIENKTFKKMIEKAFLAKGFQKVKNNLQLDGRFITLLIGLQKIEFEDQFYINVGFWIKAIGESTPMKVEHTHLYFRLERMFPEYRKIILDAGDLDNSTQPIPARDLCDILDKTIIPILSNMASSYENMKCAFDEGILRHGLVRKEALIFFQDIQCH